MHKMKPVMWGWMTLWMVVSIACGGAEPAAEPVAPAPSSGDEQAAEPADTTIAEVPIEAPQPVAHGPAQVTVIAKIGSDAVNARVKILGEDNAVMVEGTTGAPLTVQSGSLTVEVSITDSAVMIDTPTVREEIDVEAGDTRNIEIRVPRAQVKATVNVNGKPDNKATVTLMRHGAIVTTLTSGAPDFVSITPGRYSAKVKAKGAEIDVPDVVIPEDSSRNIPLNITL